MVLYSTAPANTGAIIWYLSILLYGRITRRKPQEIMKTPIVCPTCKTPAQIYGMPYGLQIGSSVKGENSAVHPVILIQCESCGCVLGGYKDDSIERP